MQIVPISYRLIRDNNTNMPFTTINGISLLQKCEYAARLSHRTEDKMTADSYDRFLRSVVLNHGDFSVIEHASVSVEVEVDRGLTHEIVRHRIAAYTQESTRFVNYDKGEGIRMVKPPFKKPTQSDLIWRTMAETSESLYKELIRLGEPPELARSVLLTSLAAKLIMTYNLRTWRHFFIMRATKEAHPQMKELTIPLLEEFKRMIPILFEDIEPGMKQSEAMRLLR